MNLTIVAAAIAPGSWVVDQTPDRMSDKPALQAELHGDNAKIVLRCNADGRLLAYNPTVYLGAGRLRSYEYRPLTYRIDNQPAVRRHWQYESKYALAPGKKAAVQLLAAHATGQRLLIRAERFDGSTIDSSFDLSGSSDVVPKLLTACALG